VSTGIVMRVLKFSLAKHSRGRCLPVSWCVMMTAGTPLKCCAAEFRWFIVTGQLLLSAFLHFTHCTGDSG